MAKKDENQSMYVNAAEQKKKAIGNPNKNVHAKRNGSNYKGTKSAQSAAEKLAAMNQPKDRTRNKMAPQVKLAIWVMVIIAVASIVLENTVFKGNELANAIMMILLGVACGVVYYTRRTTNQGREQGGLEKALDVIMLVVCILYIFMGALRLGL